MRQYFLMFSAFLALGLAACKRTERSPSTEFDPKVNAVHLPFTAPSCTVVSPNYVYTKMGTAQGTYYIQEIVESAFVKSGYRSVRISFGSNSFLEMNFDYMRPELSANYVLKPSNLSVDYLDFNDVTVRGHNIFSGSGPGSLNSDQGGLLHVEYLPNWNQYKITACDIPCTFKLNTSGATQTMTVSFQVYCY